MLVSVPGRYAAGVAGEALDPGRNVFLFSDNVPLADEVALKRQARERGLLVLGPDCGTAIVGGVGLGFANRVRRGPSASSAPRAPACRRSRAASTRSGPASRRRSAPAGATSRAEVGGITARAGARPARPRPGDAGDRAGRKPPAPAVAARLLALARATGKPVVV